MKAFLIVIGVVVVLGLTLIIALCPPEAYADDPGHCGQGDCPECGCVQHSYITRRMYGDPSESGDLVSVCQHCSEEAAIE